MVNTENIELDKDFYMSFFGKSNEYYWEKTIKHQNSFSITFNIWAFIFPSYWLIYRKLYFEFAIIKISLLIVAIMTNISWGFYAGTLLIHLILACLANRYYIHKAIKMVEIAKKTYTTRTERITFLKTKGNVSTDNLQIWIIISILASIAIAAFKVFYTLS